jgi:tetratricopeptide (TPR) repeat protein
MGLRVAVRAGEPQSRWAPFACRNMELADELYARICELSERGNELAEDGSASAALLSFEEAWDILPEPKTTWEAARWLLAAIGDMQFQLGEYEAAQETLALAMHTPDAIGNPFLHLRLGQAQFELGNETRAADELARAYLLEGTRIFADDDPKYLKFIKSKLRPPDGGWPDGW